MKKMLIASGAALLFTCTAKAAESSGTAAKATVSPPVEIGDSVLVALVKNSLDVFAHKDADNGFNDFTDDVRFYYSNGDSLIGKQSIINFWTDRFTNWYDSITTRDDIWLPVKVNAGEKPQPGNYVLRWFNNDLTFKHGKKLLRECMMYITETAIKKLTVFIATLILPRSKRQCHQKNSLIINHRI